MFVHPQIDPIAIKLGPMSIHWYGLMYLLGFIGGWGLAKLRLNKPPLNQAQLNDLLFYIGLGVIIGGRLGYILFYHPAYYLTYPLEIFKLWQGGMSFHGGLIGVSLALAWLSYQWQQPLLRITDFVAPLVPPGLAAGRLANFINAELWGKPTQVWWGVIFPQVDHQIRHPSQLYELLLEGIGLFIVLWWYSAKPRASGLVTGWFLILYASCRFLIEFFRQPDPQWGYLAFNWLTMGQLLSLPMWLLGSWLLFRRRSCKNI